MEEYRFDHLMNTGSASKYSSSKRDMTTTTSTRFTTGNYSTNSSLAVIPNSPGLSSIASNPTDRPPQHPNQSQHTLNTTSSPSIHQITAHNNQQYEEIQDKQRLEKQNFELKMKIFHLEETIHSLQEKDIQRKASTSKHAAEVNELRLQLEERTLELEERNLLLIKAKNAMEILKSELQRSQLDATKQTELQEKISGLKRMNDDIEKDYKTQLANYEQEIRLNKNTVNLKQQEISVLEDQMKQLEVSLDKAREDYSELQRDKDKMENVWISAQERIALLEEEVTQCHAHIDLYKLRVQEEQNDKTQLQNQLKELVAKKAAQEEDHRHRLQEINQSYEAQIRSMRTTHEQELEKVRTDHLQMMSDMRENYHKEAQRLKTMYDQELQDVKLVEGNEKSRQRDDFLERLNEKNEEIRTLKSQLEAQSLKLERYAHEMESFKLEFKEKEIQLENCKHEIHLKADEIAHLLTLKETIHSLQQKIIDLQEVQKTENIEKLQLSFQKENLHNQLTALQHEYKQLEAELHLLKIENSKLSYTSSDLTAKEATIESIHKEVDKYKIIQQKLSNEILEGQYKYQHLLKEQEGLQQEYQRVLGQLRKEQESCQHLAQQLESCQTALTSEKQQLGVEREERKKVETVLQELRGVVSTLQVQAEAKEGQFVAAEAERLGETEEWQRQVSEWTAIYRMVIQAMEDWEVQWGLLLEGENLPPPVAGGNSLAFWLSGQQQPPLSRFSAAYRQQQQPGYGRSSGTPMKQSSRQPQVVQQGFSRPGSRLSRATSPSTSRYQSYSSSLAAPVYASEHDYYVDLLTNHLLDAKQEVAVGIERLSLQAEKFQSIRSYFRHEQDKALAAFPLFQEKVQTTLNRYEEQLQRLSADLAQAQRSLAQRETLFAQEREQFQSLKELILKEQQEKYHSLETKYTELVFNYESLQRQHDHHQKQSQTLLEENQELQQTIVSYKKERQQLKQLEETLQSFHQKYDTIRAQFKAVENEKQKVETALQQLQQERLHWQQEKQSLLLDQERLVMQLTLLKESLSESERKYHQASHEVEKLRLRPMDVELALKLLSGNTGDSTAVAAGSYHHHNNPGNSHSVPQGGGGTARHLLEMFERLSPTKRSQSANTTATTQYRSRSNNHQQESVYFPSRRGLMASGTDRYETVNEDTSFSQSQNNNHQSSKVTATTAGEAAATPLPAGSVPAASISLSAMTSPRPGAVEALGSTTSLSSTNRLNSLDRSLQLLAQKIDAFEQSNK